MGLMMAWCLLTTLEVNVIFKLVLCLWMDRVLALRCCLRILLHRNLTCCINAEGAMDGLVLLHGCSRLQRIHQFITSRQVENPRVSQVVRLLICGYVRSLTAFAGCESNPKCDDSRKYSLGRLNNRVHQSPGLLREETTPSSFLPWNVTKPHNIIHRSFR